MECSKIYKELTNVDIEEQRQIWDERGKGYYGEYLVFCELYKHLEGCGKILMNLNIPTESGNTTEIDLLLIHETGMYVFEIKHYKGTIYGKDTDNVWTQYFRTSSNSVFKNPIEQNGYHIRALKKMFQNIPIQSIVLFTSPECELQIENYNNYINVCKLGNLNSILRSKFKILDKKYSLDEIEQIFKKLLPYSPMKDMITIQGKEADFFSWILPIITRLESEIGDLKQEKDNVIFEKKKTKKIRLFGILVNVLVAVLCILFSCIAIWNVKDVYNSKLAVIADEYNQKIEQNTSELNEFKQNFEHVDIIGNSYIASLNQYVNITNVTLKTSKDKSVTFGARLNINSEIYGVALTENSRYIVMTEEGKVFEYNVFGQHLKYSRISNMLGKGIRTYGDLAKTSFYGISNVEKIEYIKLTNIELFKLDTGRTVVKDNLELELYKK